jgi:catechol 2,3-dioxygenase-like lactoylglutathione lyase family enzyme
MHGLFFTTEPEKARAFFRDVLGFPAKDAGDGWLIFDAPAGDFGCHPSSDTTHHEISFFCDDIQATVKELEEKGAQFVKPRHRGRLWLDNVLSAAGRSPDSALPAEVLMP